MVAMPSRFVTTQVSSLTNERERLRLRPLGVAGRVIRPRRATCSPSGACGAVVVADQVNLEGSTGTWMPILARNFLNSLAP